MNDASRRQIDAARPDTSTWLSANAGSGKTTVLTDRVARLLLSDVPPQNILCLTFTKAAASEMQNRLFRRLGEWSMSGDADLRGKLASLGANVTDAETLAKARRLFARAIETPGGLRIQTIHSFCASLLRRFPLESGVTPQFTEMDDRTAEHLRADCIETVALEDPGLLDRVASLVGGTGFSVLAGSVARHRDEFETLLDEAELRTAFDLPAGLGMDELLGNVFPGDEAKLLGRVTDTLIAQGSANDRKAGQRLTCLTNPLGVEALKVLEGVLLTGASAASPFSAKVGKFPTRATRDLMPDDIPGLEALMARVEEARHLRIALAALDQTVILHRFARAFLPLYEARKAARGWVDFDDLIFGARDLLTRPDLAPWILERLDGGIDHILVDEAQDTSPAQWQVISALAQEITSGDGRKDAVFRTIFVVGDRKQSIYSFQGADPQGFDDMHGAFSNRMGAGRMSRQELLHSFRSSRVVLDAVDGVLGLRAESGAGRHIAFFDKLPGRVDLWPLIEESEAPDPPGFEDPVDRPSPHSATVRLAAGIASHIRRTIEAGETIPDPQNRALRRAVHEGDFLILLQTRGALFHEIIRACKAQRLEIAGADRMKLCDSLAVKDILALLKFLALPEDDLSLASALRSPLFGWSEQQLFDLAAGRGGRLLWHALRDRRDEFAATLAMIDDLRGSADYLRPYELIHRLLIRHGGRARLLGRLGAEHSDAVDALLTQALDYERTDVPSLTGFLAWLESDDVEIKREVESAGRRMRVMTVHGAKGLEAPIVILPETMRDNRANTDNLLPAAGTMMWRMSREEQPEVIRDADALRQAQNDAERRRLLYVAMTRARNWLVICGCGDPAKTGDRWYGDVESGIAELPSVPLETPAGTGKRLAAADWSGADLVERPAASRDPVALPAWIDSEILSSAAAPTLLTPSTLGGAKALPGEIAETDEEAVLSRGRQIHLLLEVLPSHPEAGWDDVAARLLPDLSDAALVDEVRKVLRAPGLRELLTGAALAEVGLTAPHPSGRSVSGIVDRLIVEDSRVLAIDFKSNRTVPATADAVPEGLLRQMGAYAHALATIYPDHRVETALLWTSTATLMPLPPALVAEAFERGASLDGSGAVAYVSASPDFRR